MAGGFVKRLPSKEETSYAEGKDRKAYWPAIGRFWESNGKTFMSINMIPDAIFILSKDKPKDERQAQTQSNDEEEIY